MKARELLSEEDYRNYRNVRAVSLLFVVFGTILFFGGMVIALSEPPEGQDRLHPAFGVLLGILGLAGAVGGIAARRGNRRWSPLVYGMATLYILNFPLGTILGYVMLKGLSRYLTSAERLKAAAPEVT